MTEWLSRSLFTSSRTSWPRLAVWAVFVVSICLIGAVRVETDAEFAFASLSMLPVLLIAWVDGRRSGFWAALLAATTWTICGIVAHRQFSTPWIPWINAITRLAVYCLVALLAAQVHLLLKREHDHATRDALTNLLNRRAFIEAGVAEVERSHRYGHALSVLYLDLDDFKHLNDTYGHDVGDAALRATARAMLGVLRATDLVARLGGDEFAVLLPEICYDDSIETGQKILAANNCSLRGFAPVRASIGIACFELIDRDFLSMLKAADAVMYEVKASGKNDLQSQCFKAINRSDTKAYSP